MGEQYQAYRNRYGPKNGELGFPEMANVGFGRRGGVEFVGSALTIFGHACRFGNVKQTYLCQLFERRD